MHQIKIKSRKTQNWKELQTITNVNIKFYIREKLRRQTYFQVRTIENSQKFGSDCLQTTVQDRRCIPRVCHFIFARVGRTRFLRKVKNSFT